MDGAPACPFVAFDDDRDARAASPDHRHRCYAEVRPAPRALAHQEAYCLSSAFAVCPTFQDWARREAARMRVDEPDVVEAQDTEVPSEPRRNPPRNWSAPPPWHGDEGATAPSGGLSGSMADRLAAGEPITPAESPQAEPPPAPAARRPTVVPLSPPSIPSAMARPAYPRPARRPSDDADTPSWERPRRLEAYPSLRSRVSLPSISAPPLLVGVVALVLAAVGVFFLPSLLGLGGPDQPGSSGTPGPSTSASVEPSGSAGSTPASGPTPTIYVVQPGDTLSGIAAKFGMTLVALQAANPEITDVNKIEIGDGIIIPVPIPSQIPDAGSPSPAASP